MGRLSVNTKWGQASILFSDKGICALNLPGEPMPVLKADGSITSGPGLANARMTASLLIEYFNGRLVDFSSIKLDLGSRSDFFKDICRAAMSIPFAELRTYGELAEMAGKRNAARAVGRVMAANPLPIIIPCHRVVASDGSLTGYSAWGGLETKRRLLSMEGVAIDEGGRATAVFFTQLKMNFS